MSHVPPPRSSRLRSPFLAVGAALLAGLLAGAGCASPASTRADPAVDAGPRLYLVRHVEVWANLPAADRPAGQTAEEGERLTPHGQAQALAAAGTLRATGARVTAVVTSPVGRAEGTARVLAAALDPPVSLRIDDRWSWLAKGETPEAGAARAARAAGEALDALRPGEAAVIVTHGDILPALIGWVEGTPPDERIDRHTVPKGSITTLRRTPDGRWSVAVPLAE